MVSLNKKTGYTNFDDFKEKSILQKIKPARIASSKPILRCEPDEVILQSKYKIK